MRRERTAGTRDKGRDADGAILDGWTFISWEFGNLGSSCDTSTRTYTGTRSSG